VKALVTGAAGFVGSHIVDKCLALGDEVRVLVRPSSDLSYLRTLKGIELISGDLLDQKAVAEAVRGAGVVYHSAARVLDYGTRKQFWDANVVATRYLIDAARAAGVPRFVFVSSPSVISDGQEHLDVDESRPYPKRFANLYCETKAAGEQLVLAANAPDFITCAIRPRGVWGPRDQAGPISRFIAKMVAGKLPDMSGGRKTYASICYCENAAEACTLAARSEHVGGKPYFITDAEKTDVWAFTEVIAELLSIPPVRRKIHPAVLRVWVEAVELIWKLPALSNHRAPPLSRYSTGMLTLTATYRTAAAERDFGYRAKIDQQTGLSRLKAWIDEIGGVEELVRRHRIREGDSS
jgi:nucleoside-diphosphate-sugar epimerase